MKSLWYYDYPIGKIGIAAEDGYITRVLFAHEGEPAGYELGRTPLIDKAATQLQEYFLGKRTEFDLPLSVAGTAFQRSVWRALQDIPWGETRSYKDIAVRIGNPKATRAVGGANHRNPIPIIIPCHRVVGSDGSLTGFGGGLPMKRQLLEIEKRRV